MNDRITEADILSLLDIPPGYIFIRWECRRVGVAVQFPIHGRKGHDMTGWIQRTIEDITYLEKSLTIQPQAVYPIDRERGPTSESTLYAIIREASPTELLLSSTGSLP